VADYFKRRKLVANQVIVKELEDGGLLVSSKVAHINQILPTVRSQETKLEPSDFHA
jgi:hypothetical protein